MITEDQLEQKSLIGLENLAINTKMVMTLRLMVILLSVKTINK